MPRLALLFIYAIILVIFLCGSFVFSSADMAYGCVSLSRLDNEIKKEPNKKSLLRARRIASHYDQSIATILFCNDTVNAGLDSVATLFGVNLCYLALNSSATGEMAEKWGFCFSLAVLILKITFGEIVPKSISKVMNESFARLYSGLVMFLIHLFSPITYPISLLSRHFSKRIGEKIPEVEVEEDDLHEMVDDIEEKGEVDEEKADMIHDTIRYTHTEAREIMTPRVDVYAIDVEDDLADILKDHDLYRHGRVPVYEGTIDNVIGFIQIKTLIQMVLSREEFVLRDILLEPLRVPQTCEINDIMRTFKKTKKQFALVMDEYGGLDGIVTMEDILEEIVGEIWDEKDRIQNPVVERKDGSYILDGSVTIEDYCDLFDIDFASLNTEYLTIGGFVVELLDDQFAKVGDEVDFENTHFKVIAVDENGAVSKVIVTRLENKED